MTAQGEQAAAAWRDTDFARDWARDDSFRDLLDFPRRIAAAIVAGDDRAPATIIDVGAGPGAVLEVFLRRFPRANGIWTDASRAMLDLAQEKLAPFGDRVEYRIADMTDLDGAGLPDAADVITTSSAAHHQDRTGLAGSHQAPAPRLAPGGWLDNLHPLGPASQAGPPRDGSLSTTRGTSGCGRRARKFGVSPDGPKHHHNYPLTSVQDHLSTRSRGRASPTSRCPGGRSTPACSTRRAAARHERQPPE